MRAPLSFAATAVRALVIGTLVTGALRATRHDDPPRVTAVESVGITVSDLDRALEFYRDVLTFAVDGVREDAGAEHEALEGVFGVRKRVAALHLGREKLELTQYLAPEGRPIPVDSRSNDRWFQHIAIVVRDMGEAYSYLRAHNVRHASSGPQRLPDWNPNAGGIEAFYFKDFDGHVLEVIHFPQGKGDPRWQAPTNALFLGIDHTAIVVEDTERSLAFYRDTLGLHVAGGAENWGVEQEHLNNVFGARLRITALRGESGPGVEFLEYLAPTNGRPYPLDTHSNDLWHWETRFTSPSVDALNAELRRAHTAFVSPGVVQLAGTERAVLARDPDGHAVEFHEHR